MSNSLEKVYLQLKFNFNISIPVIDTKKKIPANPIHQNEDLKLSYNL